MSDSVRPHRWWPTRLPCPWDSPGKNTGVGCHFLLQCMKVKSESEVAQSCPTLRNPMVCSLPGSSVHGIFQARTLEWGAIAFSNAWKWKMKVKSLSRVWPSATPWTAAYQAPPSMGFRGTIINPTFHTTRGSHSNRLICSFSNFITIISITPYISIVFYGLYCAPHESSFESDLVMLYPF